MGITNDYKISKQISYTLVSESDGNHANTVSYLMKRCYFYNEKVTFNYFGII